MKRRKALIILIVFIAAVAAGVAFSKDPLMESPDPSPTATSNDRVPEVVSPLPYTPVVSPGPSPSPSPEEVKSYDLPELTKKEKARRKKNRKLLAKKIAGFMKNDPAWKKAKVGMYFATLKRGRVIYSHNGNLPMIPASNLKLVTSSAALALLGHNYRFHTTIWGGEIDKSTGVMEGNLYLEGTGDPTFMEPFTKQSSETLHKFAAHLRKLGVREIEGDLVADDSAFDREYLGRGWKARYLMYEYAAPAGALSINGNCARLVITKGRVAVLPGNRYIQVIYNSKSRGRLSVRRKPGADMVKVRGRAYRTAYRNVTVNNPSKFTIGVFAEVLKRHGIKIKGKVRLIGMKDASYQKKFRQIAYHRSPPLYKIVKEINKESDNICAQHVFKGVGYQVEGKGTCDTAHKAIKDFWEKAGIDSSGFRMADGSGLSVYNKITPHQLVSLLRYMPLNKEWKYFWASLPIAGVDGTLKYRMKGIPVRAKTGGLRGHIALSGYVKTKAGQTVVFSMITNRHRHWGGRIRRNEDYVLKMIAGFNKKL